MVRYAGMEKRISGSDESHAILPMMTALFVEGLGPDRNTLRYGAQWLRQAMPKTAKARIFRLPLPGEDSGTSPFDIQPPGRLLDDHQPGLGQIQENPAQRQIAVRTLICGISHHFNNLLMGIWGNTTLIRLRLKADEPLYRRMEQMERLIQSGAFLIHMVLGYLGERRIQAKRVRLNQLIAEIKAEIPGGTDGRDPWNFEARLKWASRVQRPRMIASSTAQVLEVLFQGINSYCRDVASEKAGEKCIQKKMDAINTLVARGLEMTQQLRLYSGDFKPRMRRIRMVPLVKRLLTRLGGQNPQIKVTLAANNRLPVVCADRHQIECAVRQIISNAVQARPGDGRLDIALRTLQEEPPEERCGVHTGSDYVVITVKDSGPGIAPDIQKRIFEPFFAYPHKHGHLGLGLASADGILKAHSGYIQLQSLPGAGSTFKIYLPIAGAAVQQQNLKHPNRMPSRA